MTHGFARRVAIVWRTFRDLEGFRRNINNRGVRPSAGALAIAAMTVEHHDRFRSNFVSNRAARASTGKRKRHNSRSINVEIVAGNDVSFIILMHFFQQLLFASSLSALVRARLVATRVSAMVKDQQ